MSFSDDEYNSLRSEVVKRVEILYTSNTTMMLVFFAGLAVVGKMYLDVLGLSLEGINASNVMLCLGLIIELLFLFPLLFLVPISVKSGDNLRQMMSINLYITVFHELVISNMKDRKGWESFHIDKNTGIPMLKLINLEYFVTGFFSLCLYGIASISLCSRFIEMHPHWFILYLVITIIFGVFGIASCCFIFFYTFPTKILKVYRFKYMAEYLDIAQSTECGLLDQNKAADFFKKELNIQDKKLQHSISKRVFELINEYKSAGKDTEFLLTLL